MTGIAVPLGEGIHRISLTLPPLGPKAVNCYVVEGGDGLTPIDCGVNTRYLESLGRIVELDPPRTLPGHGQSLDAGGERALEIIEHHEERLLAVAKAATGRTTDAWGVMDEVFGAGLDPVSSVLALLETLSHLEHLARTGRLVKRVEECSLYYGR